MTTIKLDSFDGEIAMPAYAIPDSNAQYASNCDFTTGDLRPLKAGGLQRTMSSNVVGIYTEDGSHYFTWAYEVHSVKGPVIGDIYSRVYYTTDGIGGTLSVTKLSYALTNGGPPSTAWAVGVEAIATAPTLATVDLTTIRGTAVTVTATAWYELNGKQYDSATVTLTTVTALQKYTFTPPTISTAPSDARLACNFIVKNTATSEELINVKLMSGVDTPVKSDSFPGGVYTSIGLAGSTATVSLDWGIYERRAYVLTTYNQLGEESAPSLAGEIDVNYIQDVTVQATLPAFTGRNPPAGVRVYRTFGSTDTYYKVKDWAWTSGLWSTFNQTDSTYKSSDIGEALPSLDWFEPVANLRGLVAMPNGTLAAYKDNVLYLSEPFHPHAWPYSLTTPKNITGLCVGAQTLVITTMDGCYYSLISHPKTAQIQKLALPTAGLTPNSITPVATGVAFLSTEGIVVVQGSQAQITSLNLMSRDDWLTRFAGDLNFMSLAYEDGYLIATSSTSTNGFVIKTDGKNAGSFTRYVQQAGSLFRVPIASDYHVYYSSGTGVYSFKAGSNMTADWWSKEFVLGKPVNFGACFVRCTGNVTVTLYLDNVSWYTFTATNGANYYRLPAGKKGLRWSVRMQTAATLQEIVLAEAMSELRSVD